MEYKIGKKNVIFENDEITIYARRKYASPKYASLKILFHLPYQDSKKDEEYISGCFKDIDLIIKEEFDYVRYCYVVLKDKDGKGEIVELIQKKSILKGFSYKHFVGSTIKHTEDERLKPADVILRFHNRREKIYTLFSLSHELIFGPFHYREIQEYENGVILNDKIGVENDGSVINLFLYSLSEKAPVYNSRVGKNSIALIDEAGKLFYEMHPCRSNKDKMSVTAGNFEFFYDRGKDVFSFRKLPPDNECGGWTQEELEEAADIAYEGHSRLELGLD